VTDDVSQLLAGLSVAERTALELRLLRRHGHPGTTGISRRAGSGPAPLSFAQQRLWFLEQLYPGTPLHNMSRLIRLNGRLDLAVLQRSLDAIVDRHAALRTTIVATNGIPAQTVAPPSGVSMAVTDLSGLAEVERESEARRLVAEEARLPFDLVRGPLFRAVLLRLGTEEHLLVLSMHHIISDGWSREVLARELTAFYKAFATGAPAALPELPIQYADYAVWQREWLQGERLERDLRYWREQLRGAPAVLELPTDYPRPPVRSGRGARERLLLPTRLCEELRALSRREGVTLFATVLAAFQTLLARYTGQDDILVGSPIAGRTRAETEELIGFFVNTLALRTDLSGNPTFRELLRRVRVVTLGAYDHPDIPFEQLVEELQPERDISRSPIFQVLLSLQNVPQHQLELPGLTLQMEAPDSGTAKFDLTLAIFEVGASLRAEAEFSSDLFEAGTIARLLGHFRTLLEGIVADPDRRISALPLLTEPERHQLLMEWNATATDYPREATLGELFDAQVALRPDAAAVVFQHERLTYRELDARANRLARYLRGRGAGLEQRVGVCLERSVDLVIGLLAIVKAGAAYVPLDPSYPPERLRFMLDDAQAGVLLTDSRQSERMPPGIAPTIVRLDAEREAIDREPSGPLPSGVLAGDLAYVMYTSGSTGRPKGVAIPHRGIIRLVCHTDYVQLTPADHVAQVSNITFDVATWEIWGTLLNGATLVVIPREVVLSPGDLAAELRERGISAIDVTTALFNQLARDVPDVFRTVRAVQVGGEAANPDRLREILAQGPPEHLINSYGPTECTTTATWQEVREVSAGALTVPIGRPIANTPAYVLDRHRELVPVGVPGELYLGGPGLARGYFNRPGPTAERFVPNPFAPTFGDERGGRLYRTGDRVRWRVDGALEFLGRLDDQIKLRGHRIEPGEIESALREHPGVRAVIVVAREDATGGKQLVAYIVSEGTAPGSDEWRRFLQQRLPEFMVPSVFVPLETLPLAPSGKVDRRALPAPKDERPRLEQAFVPPRDSTEESVAAIWVAVLRIDRVGIHDNFFALGGHSLLATQVTARIRSTFDVELPLRAVFEAPTIAALAARIAAAPRTRAPQETPADRGELERRLLRRRLERGIPRIAPRGDGGPAPLSFAQQRLWFLEQLYPGTPLHNVSRLMRLHGKLDVAVLRRTLDAVVARHEALRTSIVTVANTPVQIIAAEASIPVAITDLGGLAEAERQTEARRLVSDATRRPFDLARGPLFRAMVLRLGAEEHLLLLTMHHIISDAWSIGVLSRELTAFYQAFTTGVPAALPELPIQYADYAVWQREWLQGERLERELAYWREQLRGAPAVLELPTDRPRPAVQSSRGSKQSLLLPARVSEGLQALSRREGVTLFATVLAAFQALLARYTGQVDIVVGAPIAGRTHTETEGLIGFFVNTLALRTDLSGDPTFRALLRRVREVTLGAYAHQHVPFEQLVEQLQPERDMSRTPVFQVALAMQNVPRHQPELPGLTLRSEATDTGMAKFDLTLFVVEQGSGLQAVLEYCTDLFDAGTVVRLLGHFRTLLDGILDDPDRRLSELPLLTQPERHQLLVEWNATATDYPRDATIGDLFQIQAARTPDALALVGNDERLTYHELELRANRLAHYLRARGAGPETRVGICLERSVDLVVGALAVVLAGAAYVPLDPGDPPDRLRFLLGDARADVLLSESRHRGRVPPGSVATTICLDDERESIAREPSGPPSPGHAGSLACVMYTSGSTGSPKGVAIAHRAVARLVLATDYFRGGPKEVFLQLAPMAFDASTFEIWGALLTGARLVVAPPGTLGLEEIGRVVREQEVTTLWLTAGLFHQMVDRGLDDLRGVRQLLAGGDVLSVAHVERVRRELPHCRLVNGYGPTESTTFASCHHVAGGELSGSVPIGRPIANTRTYVLDGRLEPVPVGLPGELYLGGPGLARGYLGRPGLTADRFTPDPFGPELGGELGGRLYRTGDRVRWRADGLLDFLGRTDDQVKLRGHRVELGEVEAALREHPAVRAAVVTAREDIPGEKQLVAYLVPTGSVPGVSELRNFLHQRLPDFMVPSAFVTLAELPLSPNGKVDRRALPAPNEARPGPEEAFVAPRNPVEELLATIWATLLRIERVGVYDNFFELGGHSLLATQVISRILTTLGVEVPLRTIFEAPTVAALATRVASAQVSEPSIQAPDLVPVAREAYRATSDHRRQP
jgi:amino acid adenylation domain-containing protein